MTAPDKCPYCGAEQEYKTRHAVTLKCGLEMREHMNSEEWLEGNDRTPICYEHQIERLTAALRPFANRFAFDMPTIEDEETLLYCEFPLRDFKAAVAALTPPNSEKLPSADTPAIP
jgi:glutaredoxin